MTDPDLGQYAHFRPLEQAEFIKLEQAAYLKGLLRPGGCRS